MSIPNNTVNEKNSNAIFMQFIERYKSLNDQPSSASAISVKAPQKMTRIGRLVARELDTDSEAEEENNVDPSKPWLAEFERYMGTHESILEDMSTVQWWGVRRILIILKCDS